MSEDEEVERRSGAYDRVGGPGVVHAGCWAHARWEFFDAVKLNPKDQTAIGIVAQMDPLFAIDAQVGPRN
jgi:hypothetical protein